MAQNSQLEENLIQHLTHAGLNEDALRQHSASLATLSERIKLERIYWKGTPWPEILIAQGRVPIESISELKNVVNNRIQGIEVFPLGIPFPEELQVNIQIPIINPVAGK